MPVKEIARQKTSDSYLSPIVNVRSLHNRTRGIVEPDHRAIKRVTIPMLNFKSFHAAREVLASIELMHMIGKGQMIVGGFLCKPFVKYLNIIDSSYRQPHDCFYLILNLSRPR